jgi:DNA-binding GntR family transcriptional regulator
VITRSPSLTEQVKAHIKQQITEGAFAEGRIPPETDLADELGVSRTTVRDALTRLEQEGAIYRRQGAGTFVNERSLRIKSRLEEIWSYEQVLEDHGYEPSVRILAEEMTPADPDTAETLDLSDGEEVLTITKLFLEDKAPVILTINRIPSAILTSSAYADDEATPLYEFVERHADRALAYYLSEIVPVVVDGDLAETLGVPEGTPAISFEEVGFDQDNEPIVRATSFFRDDLLRFALMRRRA